ncbi:MAG: helix-turn-helix transcriptional regulator [Thermoleophilia bacterium]
MKDKDLYKSIAKKIKVLRTSYAGEGLSQLELAKKLNVQPNTISRWETEEYKPKADDLQKIATFFNISITEFFPQNKEINEQNEKVKALTRLSGDLPEKDLEELIEYAKFRKARQALNKSKK